MKRRLAEDLAKLKGMAFGRLRHCGPLVKRFHAVTGKIKRRDECESLWNVYDWLLAPFTIWPVDFEGLATYLLELIEKDKPIPQRLCLLLEVMAEPPPEHTQKVIAEFERDVESGRYEKMIKRREKYEEREKALMEDRELGEVWSKIKEEFDTTKFGNKRGVIRRSLSAERNFRQGWEFDSRKAERLFQMVFDAMCFRWQLYGMEKDRPLLLKVSFNPTPYGTLMMIPHLISFDAFRDVDWASLMELHRCWGTGRQGPKMSSARMQKKEEARQAAALWEEAKRLGNKGDARYQYVKEKMGRQDTNDGWLKRLLKAAGGGKKLKGLKR